MRRQERLLKVAGGRACSSALCWKETNTQNDDFHRYHKNKLVRRISDRIWPGRPHNEDNSHPPWASHPWFRKQGCVSIGFTQSNIAIFYIPILSPPQENPLWRGPLDIHGFKRKGQSCRQGWATTYAPTEPTVSRMRITTSVLCVLGGVLSQIRRGSQALILGNWALSTMPWQ